MENINLILTVVNILILAINSSLSVFKYLTDRKLLYNERIWKPLKEKLFIPYLHKIEIYLFQKWEGDNQKKIYNGISSLKNLIDSEKSDLRMYLPAKLIHYTNHCHKQMTLYFKETDVSKKYKYLKAAQYSFLSFSREYLKLLNKCRGYSFLFKYHAEERLYLKQYHSKLEQIKLSFLINFRTPSGILMILSYALLFILCLLFLIIKYYL